jgi:hypothetical protein
MSDVNHLEPIIRPTTESATPASPAEVVVVIDTQSKQAIDRASTIHNYSRYLKYFIVAVNTTGQNMAKAAIRLPYANGLPKDQKIAIILRYEAECRQGNEKQVAETLYDGVNPGAVFNDLLAKWVHEYLNVRWNEITEAYQYEKINLQGILANKALREVGLNLNAEISVEGQDKLETIVFGPTTFRVRFADRQEEEELQVQLEIPVDEQGDMKAVLHQGISLPDWVTKSIQKYFAENISLETFCFELNSPAVKQGLRSYLNETLKSIGRKVAFIWLDADAKVPRSFRKDLEITYRHFACPEPIVIQTSALMIPHNIVRYRAKKSPELDVWVETTLRETIENVLFGVEYLDLFIEFQPLEDRIKEEMNQKAEAIGFTVKQLAMKSHLEIIAELKKIDIEIDEDENEGLFETSIPDCRIRLGIAVIARIQDMAGVSERLRCKQVISEEMKRDIHTLTKQYIRTIDPERFYMRYSSTDLKQYPQEIPVEKELSDKIVAILANEFCAEVTHLTLTRGKTKSTEDLAILMKESRDFKATVSLGDFKGSAALVVTGSFSVEGVHYNSWKRFQERDCSLEKIKKRVEDSIQAELRPISTGLILYKSQDNLNKLRSHILAAARELILNEFGVVINLTTVVCSFTGIEEERIRIARILERKTKLEDLRIEMLAGGVSLEDIESVEAQIERLKNLLRSESSWGASDLEFIS